MAKKSEKTVPKKSNKKRAVKPVEHGEDAEQIFQQILELLDEHVNDLASETYARVVSRLEDNVQCRRDCLEEEHDKAWFDEHYLGL